MARKEITVNEMFDMLVVLVEHGMGEYKFTAGSSNYGPGYAVCEVKVNQQNRTIDL